MHRRWIVKDVDAGAREHLSRALGVSRLAAGLLVARGVADSEAARAFLHPSLSDLPDPGGIAGMGRAAERIARAVRSGETVWVYTDYDVDGVTSAALLGAFFRECGAPFRTRLPRRDREGYGLHPDALREMAAAGASLVVTADCGITAVAQARLARELGVDLVITDHHTPGPELPAAAAVVNPKLPGSTYPGAALAGVGVAWNLAAAVRRRLREEGFYHGGAEPDLRRLLDLVALGTVADVVPLRGANRILVAHGLRQINRTPRIGVDALKTVAGVQGEIKAGHIGFQLGPRLNAAGRLQGPQEALDLLASDDPGAARELARVLDGLNRRRQEEEQGILEGAEDRVRREGWWPERWSLVVEQPGWHPGVIGIVASRLVDRFHRPAVVLSVEGERAKGSARSIPGLDLYDALAACGDLLKRFGGHAAAAGLELAADRVEAFRERFETAVRERLSPEDLTPVLHLDGEASFGEIDGEAVQELARLEPFGYGNPTPVLLTRGVGVLDVRPIGRDGRHLKFRVEQEGRRFDAVAWRKAETLAHVRPGTAVDLAHTPQINLWNGRQSVQLVVEGVRPGG
ncbi:MAG: single-stranded-DNA-specific exonuclease RecJ [Deferrisomatales bacterium]